MSLEPSSTRLKRSFINPLSPFAELPVTFLSLGWLGACWGCAGGHTWNSAGKELLLILNTVLPHPWEKIQHCSFPIKF